MTRKGWWLYLIVDNEAIPLLRLSQDQAVEMDDFFVDNGAEEHRLDGVNGPWPNDGGEGYLYKGVLFAFWLH